MMQDQGRDPYSNEANYGILETYSPKLAYFVLQRFTQIMNGLVPSTKSEPIIWFCESETGEIFWFPFFSLSAARFIPHEQPYSQWLILYFPLATVQVVGGPKVLEFYEAFCRQRAALLRSDGKDILSVKVLLNGEQTDGAGS